MPSDLLTRVLAHTEPGSVTAVEAGRGVGCGGTQSGPQEASFEGDVRAES